MGEITPFVYQAEAISRDSMAAIAARIQRASKAKQNEYVNVTPEYWEAREKESRILAFQEYKVINKKTKDSEGREVVTKGFAVVFVDGAREVIMSQIAILDGMKSSLKDEVFKITCTSSVAGKTKKFDIERYDG
jgi:hypothetical protein